MVRKVRCKYVCEDCTTTTGKVNTGNSTKQVEELSFALNISTSVEQLIAILAVLTRSNDYEKIYAKTQN